MVYTFGELLRLILVCTEKILVNTEYMLFRELSVDLEEVGQLVEGGVLSGRLHFVVCF